jgi:hypothetical protein
MVREITAVLSSIHRWRVISSVQRVLAVGEPPEDKICFFRGLKNVVVLPAVGA